MPPVYFRLDGPDDAPEENLEGLSEEEEQLRQEQLAFQLALHNVAEEAAADAAEAAEADEEAVVVADMVDYRSSNSEETMRFLPLIEPETAPQSQVMQQQQMSRQQYDDMRAEQALLWWQEQAVARPPKAPPPLSQQEAAASAAAVAAAAAAAAACDAEQQVLQQEQEPLPQPQPQLTAPEVKRQPPVLGQQEPQPQIPRADQACQPRSSGLWYHDGARWHSKRADEQLRRQLMQQPEAQQPPRMIELIDVATQTPVVRFAEKATQIAGFVAPGVARIEL